MFKICTDLLDINSANVSITDKILHILRPSLFLKLKSENCACEKNSINSVFIESIEIKIYPDAAIASIYVRP